MSCSFPTMFCCLFLHNICLSISEYTGGEEGLIASVIYADQEARKFSQFFTVCSWLVFLRTVPERLVTVSLHRKMAVQAEIAACLFIY